jgi:hypothetical protein
MLRKTQAINKKKLPPIVRSGRNRWIEGLAIGQLLGFGVAVLVVASVPALLVAMVAGGFVGGLAGAKLKPKPEPVKDKRIRTYVFEALKETRKKLDQIFINEEFNGAANGDSKSPKQAQKAQPRLAPAQPMPPRMGGI